MQEKGTVLLLGQNIVFLGQVENLAEPQGYTTRRATTEERFWTSYEQTRPALILVDLEGEEATWTKVLEGIQQRGVKPEAKIVAFGPHEAVDTMERARTLGCDLALSKGEFSRDLPKIIGELGGGG